MNNLIGISGRKQSGKDAVFKIIQELTDNRYENVKFAEKLKNMVCLLLGCTREQLEDQEFKNTPLGEEWDRYRLEESYMPETLDSERHEFYEDTLYFSSYQNAVLYGATTKIQMNVPDEEKSYGMSSSYEYGISKERLTPRKIMQLLGTECGRDIIHPNIWVNATMAMYKPSLSAGWVPTYDDPDNRYLSPIAEPVEPSWIITDCRFPNEAKAIKDRGGILIRINRPGLDTSDEHISETALDDYKDWDYVIENDGTLDDLKTKVKKICE